MKEKADCILAYRYAASDRLLPTLGILLIELCFGTTLESQDLRREYSKTMQGGCTSSADLDAALDLAVALEWSQSVAGEAGEDYHDAVQWCLRHQGSGAKDHKWRQDLFANVEAPLQSCHEQFTSKAKS